MDIAQAELICESFIKSSIDLFEVEMDCLIIDLERRMTIYEIKENILYHKHINKYPFAKLYSMLHFVKCQYYLSRKEELELSEYIKKLCR